MTPAPGRVFNPELFLGVMDKCAEPLPSRAQIGPPAEGTQAGKIYAVVNASKKGIAGADVAIKLKISRKVAVTNLSTLYRRHLVRRTGQAPYRYFSK